MRALLLLLRRRPLASRALLALVSAALGAAILALAADDGRRAATSFVLGVFLAAAAFEIGRFNLKLVSLLAPTLSLLMALLSYGLTTLVLALVLAAARPTAISGEAIAAGLVIGVLIWTVGQLAEVWVVQERP